MDDSSMRIAELCRRLDIDYRDARYVLEQGILPEGVDEKPGRGLHRWLTPSQAFWLAIVLKLKQAGVRTLMAQKAADFSRKALTVPAQLRWDSFSPFEGRLETDSRWLVQIADNQWLRFLTNACPVEEVDHPGGFRAFPWMTLEMKRASYGVEPVVIIEIDLSRIAHKLRVPVQ